MKNIVFSNYLNAWSLKKGLKNIGLDLFSIEKHLKFVSIIEEKEIKIEDTLFFTEENSLKNYVNKSDYNFEPPFFNMKMLDDKLEFAKYLTCIDEDPIPSREIKNCENEYPFYLKCKHSWKNGVKLPRGYIVKNQIEVNEVFDKIKKFNWNIDWFFHQKLLNSSTENNISVSGYFDYKNNRRNALIISKKTLGSTDLMPTGAVIETIKEPENLINRTNYILNEMQYQGPFELEFFYEEKDNKYYVLELNPRFWMQHGIFIDLYDNAIIKRYLHIDKESDWYENGVPPYKQIFWIDSIYMLISLSRFRLKPVLNVLKLNGKKTFYPSIPITIMFAPRIISNIISNKIKN